MKKRGIKEFWKRSAPMGVGGGQQVVVIRASMCRIKLCVHRCVSEGGGELERLKRCAR